MGTSTPSIKQLASNYSIDQIQVSVNKQVITEVGSLHEREFEHIIADAASQVGNGGNELVAAESQHELLKQLTYHQHKDVIV